MASIVDLEFRASANFSDLISQVNAANQQIQRLSLSMQRLNVESFNSAMASFSRSLAQSGQFTTQSLIIDDGVKKFGKALGQGNLSLRESTTAMREFIRTRDGQVRQLARQQVQLERSVWTSTGRSASGQSRGMLATPTGLPNDAATSAALATKEMQIFHRVINETSKGLINWGKNTQWAGRQLMVGLSIPLSIFGTTAAKTFMDFDKELTRLSRVYGASITSSGTQALDSIKSQVKDLSRELSKALGIPAAETAGLAADLAATGLEGEKLIGAIKQTSILATLGEVDRQQAMKTTLSLQSVFRSDTKQLAKDIDFLNAVENQTSASIDDLTTAIPKAGPVVRGLGGDVKDLATMLVAMKEGGIPAGEAANAIKSSLSALINPTKEVSKYMKTFGIDLTEIVDKNAGKLMPTLNEFQGKLNALDDLSRQRVLEKLFGKMQVGRITALFNNLNQEGSQSVEVMKLAGMATADLAALTEQELSRAANSVSGQFKRATENLKSNLVPIGEEFLKLGTKIFGALGTMLEKFNNLPSGFKQFILGLTTIVAIVGPVIMLVGVFANFFGYLVKAGVLLSAFKKGGLSAFKYVTAEEQAAKLAGDQLTKTFYDQVTATNTFKNAVANLALQFKELADNATAASVATGNASQSPAGRAASERVAIPSAISVGSSTQVAQEPGSPGAPTSAQLEQAYRSMRDGSVAGKYLLSSADPSIVSSTGKSKGRTFKQGANYDRAHLLSKTDPFWNDRPLSALGIMPSPSWQNKYQNTLSTEGEGFGFSTSLRENAGSAEERKKDADEAAAQRDAASQEYEAAKKAAKGKNAGADETARLTQAEKNLRIATENYRQKLFEASSYKSSEVVKAQSTMFGQQRYLDEQGAKGGQAAVDAAAKQLNNPDLAARQEFMRREGIGGKEDQDFIREIQKTSQEKARNRLKQELDTEQKLARESGEQYKRISKSSAEYRYRLAKWETDEFNKALVRAEEQLQARGLQVGGAKGTYNIREALYGTGASSGRGHLGPSSVSTPQDAAASQALNDAKIAHARKLNELTASLSTQQAAGADLSEAQIIAAGKLAKLTGQRELAELNYTKALDASAKLSTKSATNPKRIAAEQAVIAAEAALVTAIRTEIAALGGLTTETIIETEQYRMSNPNSPRTTTTGDVDVDGGGDTTLLGLDEEKEPGKKAGRRLPSMTKVGMGAMAAGSVASLVGPKQGALANLATGAMSFGVTTMMVGQMIPPESMKRLGEGITKMTKLGGVTGATGKAMAAFSSTVRAGMLALLGPIGAVIAIVAGLGATVWYVNRRTQDAAKTTQSFMTVSSDMATLFNQKLNGMKANLSGLSENIDEARKRYDELKKAIDAMDSKSPIKKLIEDLKNEADPERSITAKLTSMYSSLVLQGLDPQKAKDAIQVVLDEAGQGKYKVVVNAEIDQLNLKGPEGRKKLIQSAFDRALVGAIGTDKYNNAMDQFKVNGVKNADKPRAEEDDSLLNTVLKALAAPQDAASYNSQRDDAIRSASGQLALEVSRMGDPAVKGAADQLSNMLGNISAVNPAGFSKFVEDLKTSTSLQEGFWMDPRFRQQFIEDLGVVGTKYEALIKNENSLAIAANLAFLAQSGVSDVLAENAYNADKAAGSFGTAASAIEAMTVAAQVNRQLALDIQAATPKMKESATSAGKRNAVASGYDAQKKAIQGKIDVIKKEIDAINKKLEAEKKAFEFERKMRASQISYREALAAGQLGEAALIKNQMNNDMLDKQKEDEAKAKIDPKQAEIDKLQKQLDAIDKLKENSSNTSVDTTDDVKNADNLEKAWTAVTDGISNGSIKSADDIKNKLSPALYDAIKKGGFAIDEFYNKAKTTIYDSIKGSIRDLDKVGREVYNKYTKASGDLVAAMQMANDVSYMASRGANVDVAMAKIKDGTLKVLKDAQGTATGFTLKDSGGRDLTPASEASQKLFPNNNGAPGDTAGFGALAESIRGAFEGALGKYGDGNSLRTRNAGPSKTADGGANYYNYYGSGMGGSNSYSDMGGGADDYDHGMGGSNSYSGSGASAYNGRSSYLFGPQKSSALYDATADQQARDNKASTPASSVSSSGTGSSSASSSSSGTQDSSYLEGSADASAGSYQKVEGTWLARDVKGPFDRVRMKSWANYPFYNNREGRAYGGRHAGLDYPAAVGTNVFTTRGGKVVMSRYMASTPGYGNFVVVEDDKLKYVYAHLSTRNVKEGDSVVEGQQIGKTGRSGLRKSDPHLHFEVRDKDSSLGNRNWRSTYDPRNYLHTGGNVNKLSTADKSLKRDEVPAVLQSGEYVIQRKAVSRYGEGFMHMINNGDLSDKEVPKFHTGGMVPHAHEDGPNSSSMSYNPKTGKRKITRKKRKPGTYIRPPGTYLSAKKPENRQSLDENYTEDFHRRSGFMGLLHKAAKIGFTPYEQGISRALSTALLSLNTGKGLGGLNPREAWNNSKYVAPGQALAGGIDALNNKWTRRDRDPRNSQITPEEELRSAIANRSKITSFSGGGALGKIANLSSGVWDGAFRLLDPMTWVPMTWAFKGAKALTSPLTKGIKAATSPLARGAKSISGKYKNSRFASDRGEADINPMNWLRRGAKLSEKDAARTEEVSALLRASNKEAGSDAFSGMPVTELGELTGALGGRSSAIPGVNGTYRDPFGQLHVVKGHTDAASAYAEARGSQLTTDLFGLKTPDQKVIKFRHPITGDRMFGVRSTFDEKFAEPTGKFTDDEFYRQAVASVLRRDKDLQPENLYGNIVADQGQAFVASKASQPRTVGGLRLPVGDQVRANFLMEKAGARTWFAETTAEIAKRASKSEYSAGFQKAIDDALANFDSAMANLGKLSPEEAAMYNSLKDDLIQLSKTDWAEVQAHHAQIVPKVAKPKTDAAIKKAAEAKAARKLEAQKSIDSGMPEWLLSMRDTLSARMDAMKGMAGDDSGVASIDMLTGGLGKLVSSIGRRIPRRGIESALDRGVLGNNFMDEISKAIQAEELAPKLINGSFQRPVLSDMESQVGTSSISKLKKLSRRSSLGDKISSLFDSNSSTDMIRITSGSDEGQLITIKDFQKMYDSLPEEARGYLPEFATVKTDVATRTKGVTVGGMEPADRAVNATGEFLIRPADVEAWMYAGNFDRTIRPVRSSARSKNSVSNNIMSIEQDFQGSGLATDFTRRMDSIYPRIGVDRNTVETADAGTSVWGKLGFDLDRYDNAASRMNRVNSSSSPQWLDNMEMYGLDAEYPDLYQALQAFKDGRNPGFSIQDIMRNPESSTIFRGSGWYGEKVYPKIEPKKSPVENVLAKIVERQRAKAMASTDFGSWYDQQLRINSGQEKAPKPKLAQTLLNRLQAPKAERSSVVDRLKSAGSSLFDRLMAGNDTGALSLGADDVRTLRASLTPGPATSMYDDLAEQAASRMNERRSRMGLPQRIAPAGDHMTNPWLEDFPKAEVSPLSPAEKALEKYRLAKEQQAKGPYGPDETPIGSPAYNRENFSDPPIGPVPPELAGMPSYQSTELMPNARDLIHGLHSVGRAESIANIAITPEGKLLDLTAEELNYVANAIEDHLAKLTGESDAMTQMPESGLEGFLRDGRIQTNFELPARQNNPDLKRVFAERTNFGYQEDMDILKRPTYGTIGNKYVDNPYTRPYGPIKLVLDPKILDRATLAMHDTFDMNVKSSPARFPRIQSLRKSEYGFESIDYSNLASYSLLEPFTELQFHAVGGKGASPKLEDIQEIIVPGRLRDLSRGQEYLSKVQEKFGLQNILPEIPITLLDNKGVVQASVNKIFSEEEIKKIIQAQIMDQSPWGQGRSREVGRINVEGYGAFTNLIPRLSEINLSQLLSKAKRLPDGTIEFPYKQNVDPFDEFNSAILHPNVPRLGQRKISTPSAMSPAWTGTEYMTISLPNIPGLRSGGTINNDNTLANLHQGEMVLTQPLTQKLNDGINALSYMLARPNNSMSSISSGQPAQQVASAPVSYYNLTVQPSPGMDEDALANRVVRKLKDHERRVGMARR